MKKRFFLTISSLIILLPSIASAVSCPPPNGPPNGLNLCYPTFGSAAPLTINTNLTGVVAWFYYLIVTISGLAAFVMLVWGGFQYLTSAGNPTLAREGQDKIKNAVFGLLLILASYIILQIINPDLTLLVEP